MCWVSACNLSTVARMPFRIRMAIGAPGVAHNTDIENLVIDNKNYLIPTVILNWNRFYPTLPLATLLHQPHQALHDQKLEMPKRIKTIMCKKKHWLPRSYLPEALFVSCLNLPTASHPRNPANDNNLSTRFSCQIQWFWLIHRKRKERMGQFSIGTGHNFLWLLWYTSSS